MIKLFDEKEEKGFLCFFFFSSRRRHPSFSRDWSSDVCSSDLPIGAYSAFEVTPTCGLASSSGLIGYLDDPNAFYEPERIGAQLLWFRSGFVEYLFPDRVPPGATVVSAQLTAEVSSEAPLHDLYWPSDISVWINGIHLGEWTCP